MEVNQPTSSFVKLSSICLCVCVCMLVLQFKECVIMENTNSRSDADIYIPQVLWNWRLETTWSFWSPGPQQTCPWVEIPPFWVLSNWLKLCHLTSDPRGDVKAMKCQRWGNGSNMLHFLVTLTDLVLWQKHRKQPFHHWLNDVLCNF